MKAILPTRLILWMTLGMLGFSSTALISSLHYWWERIRL